MLALFSLFPLRLLLLHASHLSQSELRTALSPTGSPASSHQNKSGPAALCELILRTASRLLLLLSFGFSGFFVFLVF